MAGSDDNNTEKHTAADDGASMSSLFSDVKPLKKSDRADLLSAKKAAGKVDKEYARKVASSSVSDGGSNLAINEVSDDYVEWLKPNDIVSFKRSGVQEGVFRKLRLGKYSIDGRLDLHRKTVKEAKREVRQFVDEALEHESRTVMILHGKGERSVERQAVIKSHLVGWLKQMEEVLAFHSAQPQHGGTGAVYVMLRKSESAKEKARERHAKRG